MDEWVNNEGCVRRYQYQEIKRIQKKGPIP